MLPLVDVLPKQQLAARFGSELILEEYGRNDLKRIAILKPAALHGIAGNVWNRIVQKGWHKVNLLQFASNFRQADPYLHEAISSSLGVEVIRDIYYARAWKGAKRKSNLILEALVAWVYRNDLQVGDITFIDPAQRIPRSERRFQHQTHRGLGLLPTFISNLKQIGRSASCEQLTLTAASADLVPLFGRLGFRVEDSELGHIGMQLGYGIPMEHDLV